MKILEAGALRYLLLNREEIDRNFQRRAHRGAAALVVEADPAVPGTYIHHNGFGVLVEGTVAFVYDPTGKVAVRKDPYRGRRVDERAAYATYGRIAIAETLEEAESLMLRDPGPEAPVDPTEADSTTTQDPPKGNEPKRPSAKKASVKKPEEGTK